MLRHTLYMYIAIFQYMSVVNKISRYYHTFIYIYIYIYIVYLTIRTHAHTIINAHIDIIIITVIIKI